MCILMAHGDLSERNKHMLKVLLVEDEAVIRRGLRFQMDWTAVGCTVVGEASDGERGLELISSLQPDIVITDIRMQGMDGLEMLAAGKKIHQFDAVIISGYGEFDYAKKAIGLGVEDYLLKPIDLSELAACLNRISLQRVQHKKEKAYTAEGHMGLDPGKMNSRYVSAMLRYIQKHYADRISITDVSQELKLSCTYLNAKFKAETGYTFHDFLNYYRICKAVELQMQGEYRLYEIAEMVGFSDYKYFNKVYKKYVGYAPTKSFQPQMGTVNNTQTEKHGTNT